MVNTTQAQVTCEEGSVGAGDPMKAKELCCYKAGGVDYQCWGRPNFDGKTEGSFEVTADDPDDDDVFFEIDWGEGAGFADRYPAIGYLDSPAVQSLSHDFAGVGSYVTIARVTDDGIPPQNATSNAIPTFISEIKQPVEKIANTSFAIPTQSITYTIRFQIGSVDIRHLQVRDEFPYDNLLNDGYIDVISSTGECPGAFVGLTGTVDVANNRVVWDFPGDVPKDTWCEFTLVVEVVGAPSDSYSLINKAIAEALNADPVESGEVTVQIITGDPWFQTFWGDLHSDGGIGQDAHDDDTADYVISADEGFDPAKITSGAGTKYLYPDYRELASVFTLSEDPAVTHPGAIWENVADVLEYTIFLWADPLVPDSGNVQEFPNLEIAPDGDPIYLSRGGTVIVNGDLEINGDLSYAPFTCPDYEAAGGDGDDCRQALPSVGFIVHGNVIVGEDVTHLVGAFRVEGSFIIEPSPDINPDKNDDPIRLDGSIYAQKFELGRDFVELDSSPYDPAAEAFYYDGRVLVNTPPGFEAENFLLPTWRRIEVP